MPKISEEPMTKVLAQPFASDLEFLRQMFSKNIGVNAAIRNIIRSYVIHTKAEAAKHIDEIEAQGATVDIDAAWDKLLDEVP